MTTQVPPLMPAGNNPTLNLTTGKDREGVNNVAIFESRQPAEGAADGSADIERVLLLEYLRQRRKMQQRKESIESGIYHLRSSR